MCIIGQWQTVIQFDSLALVAEFLIADVPTFNVLLGSDFLSTFGAVIDLGNKCCHILGKTLLLTPAMDMAQPQIVTVQADTVVPPRSEVIILGVAAGTLGGVC